MDACTSANPERKRPQLPSTTGVSRDRLDGSCARLAPSKEQRTLEVRRIQIRPCQRLPSPPTAEGPSLAANLEAKGKVADIAQQSMPSPVSPCANQTTEKPVPPLPVYEDDSFIPFTCFIDSPDRLRLLAPHMAACMERGDQRWFHNFAGSWLDANQCQFYDRFKVISLIGKGNNRVYKVFDCYKKQYFAAKTITHNGDSGLQSYIHREFAYGRESFCSCTVDYVHYYIGKSQDILVMELCSRGDLLGYIRQCVTARAVVPEAYVWTTLAQLAYAVFSCHSNGIVHADLKPQNVFLTDHGIKLGDFGLSNKFCENIDEHMHLLSRNNSHSSLSDEQFLLDGPAGTEDYEAPELLHKLRYNHAIDIWGFGCVAYELAACQPFINLPRKIISSRTFAWTRYVETKLLALKQRGYSTSLIQLIYECLSPHPRNRPKTRQLYVCCNRMQLRALGTISTFGG